MNVVKEIGTGLTGIGMANGAAIHVAAVITPAKAILLVLTACRSALVFIWIPP